MQREMRTQKAAFTLIEVVMSLALLTVGLGASMTAISQAIQVTATCRSQQTALHEARRQMEFWKINEFNGTNLVASTYPLINADHEGEIAVVDVNADTKRITVRVQYDTQQANAAGMIELSMHVVRAIH